MTALPQTDSCFACGKRHPHGLNLAMTAHGDRVSCLWTPRPDQTGFQDAVHGGLIATALDEVMAWACGILGGRFAYSVDIHIRYRNILQPGMEVECVGELTSAPSARLIGAKAMIQSKDRLIATSTGKYMPLKNFSMEKLQAEFGDAAQQIRPFLKLSG